MKGRKACTVSIFLGILLIVIFAVGLYAEDHPGILTNRYRYDLALEHFIAFCVRLWLPAGVIGIPLFLISLIISLIREKKEKG